MTQRKAVLAVVAAAVVPRLVVLGWERERILTELTEKSDRFAQTLVETGTFGFLPDRPSAYTQPLYGAFLAAVYWVAERHWLVVGLAQVALAAITALLVLAIGRRVTSVGTAATAAVIATAHPLLVWHDVHLNREILDQPLAAAVVLVGLLAFERATPGRLVALGVLSGLAVLGNARLALLPVLLAAYAVWRVRPIRRAALAAAAVVVAATLTVTPWLVRNGVSVGCVTLTTDTRALWKANNASTYDILARGEWIDDVPEPAGAPPWPELAADLTLAGTPTTVDECNQAEYYRGLVFDFWRDHPGEKARLVGQAVGMLWSPTFSVESEGRGAFADKARDIVEPVYMIALYALALLGIRRLPGRLLALAGILLVLNTAAAAVFAGTVRYRAPFDFLLALAAAGALAALIARMRARRGP